MTAGAFPIRMTTTEHSRLRGWRPRLAVALLLVLCGGWAYGPALNRMFAADQLMYFLHLDGETSLSSGLRLLDYTAVREYEKGDEALHRPLLMAGLAAENAAFKRDFRRWNWANLAVHLGIAYLLFELLWRLRPTILAGAAAVWFVLLASNFEQVSWNHLGGYMLGFGGVLVALWAAREAATSGDRPFRWLWLGGFALAGAMLVHEIAVVAAFGIGAYVFWMRRRQPGGPWLRPLLAWALPLLIYAVLYGFHVARCERWFWADDHGSAGGAWLAALAVPPRLVGDWVLRILLPGNADLAVLLGDRSHWLVSARFWPLGAVWAYVGWTGLLVCAWPGLSRERLKAEAPFAALLLFVLGAYAAMNSLGRPNPGDIPYYAYFPALIGAVLFWLPFDPTRIDRRRRTWATVFLLLLALLNGWKTRQTSLQVQTDNAGVAQHYAWLERQVRPGLARPDYTFSVTGVTPCLNPSDPVWVGYPDQRKLESVSIYRFLYGKRFDPAAPAETFAWPGTPAARP